MVPYRHADGPGDVTWRVRTRLEATERPSSAIIKGSWQVEERETIEANVYDALKGAFGTPDCLYCVQGHNRRARSWSNIVWLPDTKKDIPERFWRVGSKTQPEDVERRYFVLTSLATEGEHYTEVKQAKNLVEFLVHSVLGASSFSRALDFLSVYYDPLGWWSVFNAGYLHRDVSIGNILVAKQPFNSKQAFSFDVEDLIARCIPSIAVRARPSHRQDPTMQEIMDRMRRDGKEIKELLQRIDIERT